METKDLKEQLFYKKQSVYQKASAEAIDDAYAFAVDYMKYLDDAKTEREAVDAAIIIAEAAGFKPYTLGQTLNVGDKCYYNNRGKNLFLFTIGSEDIHNGIRISAAHIDSPRIDIKPVPLYEDEGMSFLKTHYYGGVRKYQWLAIPLALHGVVVKADGTQVNVVIGEDEGDPVLYINDLLPHLAANYNSKPLGSAIEGEKLNILIGSRPLGDEDNAIKLNAMKILNDKYGIVEEDFLTAELSIVPAQKARDVGLDRSMIGAYGHDDRVCSYPAIEAIFDSEIPERTAVAKSGAKRS